MDGTTAFGREGRRPRVISMFSGMEAASVAAHPLGWEFAAFAEVDPAACQTLHHHYGCGRPVHMPRPEEAATPAEAKDRASRIRSLAGLPDAMPGAPVNLGDMTQVDWSQFRGKVDVVVGGPPCQAFSFAGLRRSLDDDRGNLSLAYVRAIHAIEPLWSFTENVPGWLSTKDNAFGCYLGALVGADTPLPPPSGGRWGSAGAVDGPLFRAAWRILDAQGFVPQRRRRVFVVASRIRTGGNPVRVLWESEAEVERNLGERAHRGTLFPVREGGERNPRARREALPNVARDPARGAQGGGGPGLTQVEDGERGLLDLVPQGYRVHAAYSTAMTSNGAARVADPVQSTRSLDTCGGFATNQGGNIVVQPMDEPLREWIPEVSTTLRARDAKGSPDSDCTQTLIAVAGEAPDGAIAFHARQDPDSGDVVHALDTDGYSIAVLEEADAEAAEAYFLHCNKGRPAGRKSAHEEMVTVKDIVETLTTDGHAQSAIAHRVAEGHVVSVEVTTELPPGPLAFSSKDHGADVGLIAPTLRAAPHHLSHPNSGSHVAICMVAGDDGCGFEPGEARIFQDSEFGVAEYDNAGTLRAGRIPEHQMILEAIPEATVYDDPRRFDIKGIHGGGDHGEVHPTLESTNPKQIACIRDGSPAPPPGAARRIWMLVRRLTPTECLALQGFPRDYLDGVLVKGKPLADGPRYKMAGNSWCCPLIHWVFKRLDEQLAEQDLVGPA